MGYYFENHLSMFSQVGMQVERSLDAVVRRYLGLNPPHPLTFRAYNRSGIGRGPDYRYHVDFNQWFPEAAVGQSVTTWAKLWSDAPAEILFDINCNCPTVLHVNGQCIFRSTIFQERYPERRTRLSIALQAGWNHFVLRFRKTRAGFGGVFGTWLGKLPYYFLLPTAERDGQEGWLFTEPLSGDLAVVPTQGTTEAATGVHWLPRATWAPQEAAMGQFRRLYGLKENACAVAWTKAWFLRPGIGKYALSGRNDGVISIYVGEKEVFATDRIGPFSATIKVPFGFHDVLVKSTCRGDEWGFDLALRDGEEEVELVSPCNLTGSLQRWIYIGPFSGDEPLDLRRLRDVHRVSRGLEGDIYWRLDAPDQWVRLYNENPLFGKWNYPLGVTLYGLLHSARAIGSDETQAYVVAHVQQCCDTFHYATWDKEQYGGATNVHHLLTSLDSLDDCGSFGSVLLEVAKYHEIRGYRDIADLVARYIEKEQVRLPDGTFFRKNLMHSFHEDTMWADDLYMSVPFLCRYFQLTGERKYIDDAASQFLGFKRHLYMPELKVMSHVYDFRRQMATGVPWGRGNGWVIFSLSELLAVLPDDHERRPELLAFFNELSSGFLALQDGEGMWHQVLNEHDSYPETSCTSMIACGFARGIRQGWIARPEPYVRAVFKAWEAMNRISIDRHGNVYGVCRGSEFSFTSEYYKKELPWSLNDTHGIGIVLLAGVEVLRLMAFLQNGSRAP